MCADNILDPIERLILEQLRQLPKCGNYQHKFTEDESIDVHHVKYFDDTLIAICHPLQFGWNTVLMSREQVQRELDCNAFRLPEDRFLTASAELRHLLGLDQFVLNDLRVDYQTVYDRAAVSSHYGYHSCQIVDRPYQYRRPEIIVRLWHREVAARIQPWPDLIWEEVNSRPGPPQIWKIKPARSCRVVPSCSLDHPWANLFRIVPSIYDPSERPPSPYHYQTIEEGEFGVKIDWEGRFTGSRHYDSFLYLVCQLTKDATAEELAIWPQPQPLSPGTGLGWE